jgi:hypothetical protein
MSLSVPALTTTVSALRYQLRRMDRAAQVLSAAGLEDLPGLAPEASADAGKNGSAVGAGAGDFTEAMLTMLQAQRAALAQLRTIQMKEQMLKDLADPEHDGPGH